jgi:hypothetical protein
MNRHLLSKSTFIRGVQCPKSLYLHKKRPFLRDKISAAQLAKFRRGTDVGVLARDLFPGGIDMTPKSPSQYQKKVIETAEAIQDLSIKTIYEAVFQYDDVLIMLDILVRDGHAWKAFEVKSSRAISATYLTDAALQYYVLEGSGIPLSDFSLIYVNKEYVLENELELGAFFMSESVLDQCKERLGEINKTVGKLKNVLQLQNSPDVPVGWHCNKPYPCDFIGHCWKKIPENHIFKLSAIDPDTISGLSEKGIFSVDQISEKDFSNPQQLSQLNAMKSNCATFDAQTMNVAMQALKKQNLIFTKTVFHRPAVPERQGTRPYQALPLALSYTNPANQTILIADNTSTDFVGKFASTIIDLCANQGMLLTDDVADLRDFIDNSKQLVPDELQPQLLACRKQIHGLKQLLADCHYFHPAFGTDFSLQNLSAHILLNDLKLKEEAWLIQDLLNPDEASQNEQRYLKNFSVYISIIRELFEYFSKS